MNPILLFSYSIFTPMGQNFIPDRTIYYSELNCPRSTLTCSQSVFSICYHRRASAEFATALQGCMSKLSKLFSQSITVVHDYHANHARKGRNRRILSYPSIFSFSTGQRKYVERPMRITQIPANC